VPDMTPRERIVATLHGQPVDRVPFTTYDGIPAPREQVVDLLGEEAIGFTRWSSAHRIEYPNCTIDSEDFEHDGEKLRRVTYDTPKGRLEEVCRFDPTYGSLWHVEFPIKEPADYDAYISMMEDAVLARRSDAPPTSGWPSRRWA